MWKQRKLPWTLHKEVGIMDLMWTREQNNYVDQNSEMADMISEDKLKLAVDIRTAEWVDVHRKRTWNYGH